MLTRLKYLETIHGQPKAGIIEIVFNKFSDNSFMKRVDFEAMQRVYNFSTSICLSYHNRPQNTQFTVRTEI